MEDPDPDIQSSARWQLVETGDPRPCPALYKEMIDGATGIHLLDDPAILERLLPLADDSDELVRETARRVLRWQEEAQSKAKAEDIRGGLRERTSSYH